MRTWRPWWLLAFAVALAACAVVDSNPVLPTSFDSTIEVINEGSGQEYGPELFPAGEGDRWLYLENGDETRPWMTWPTTDSIEINGQETAVWKWSGEPGMTADAWFRVTDGAVYDFGNVFGLYPCSVPRLEFPVRVAKSWATDCSDDGRMSAVATVQAVERVRTDVGWFDAVRVDYDVQSVGRTGSTSPLDWWLKPGNHHETWWFAPGVGVVQRELSQGHIWVLRYGKVGGEDVAGDPQQTAR